MNEENHELTPQDEEEGPAYVESFIASRMRYMGRVWQLDWDVEHTVMRLSVVKALPSGSNTEVVNVIAYIRPGHKHYIHGRTLNETLAKLVLEVSDGTPPQENSYVSPWEKHFSMKRGQ